MPSGKTILSEVFRSLLTCCDAFPGGLEALKEVEIFEADNFVLRMTQTYAHRFQCNLIWRCRLKTEIIPFLMFAFPEKGVFPVVALAVFGLHIIVAMYYYCA